MRCKVLLPVDGSDGSARAARHVARFAAMAKDLEVHVVNIQSRGDDWMVRRMIKPEELVKLEGDWAESAMARAEVAIEAAPSCPRPPCPYPTRHLPGSWLSGCQHRLIVQPIASRGGRR